MEHYTDQSDHRNPPVVTRVLHRDYETRSRVDLRKVGATRYAADPSTEVLCAAFAVDDGPVQLWRPVDPVPPEFFEAAANPTWVVAAHNGETAIEQHVLHARFYRPLAPLERHRCTMAMSLAAGLPARLSAAADALELENRKDAAGERLMHLTSKPRKPRKGEDPGAVYYFDDQERLDRPYSKRQQDVEVERELRDRLPPLLAAEQMLSALSNRINERGFHVDCAFAQAARRIAQEAALAITRLRVKRGLPEFDDGLPGEPDAPFRMNRSIILTPFPSHSAGAHRGEARLDHTPFHQHEETRHD